MWSFWNHYQSVWYGRPWSWAFWQLSAASLHVCLSFCSYHMCTYLWCHSPKSDLSGTNPDSFYDLDFESWRGHTWLIHICICRTWLWSVPYLSQGNDKEMNFELTWENRVDYWWMGLLIFGANLFLRLLWIGSCPFESFWCLLIRKLLEKEHHEFVTIVLHDWIEFSL